MKSMSQMMGRSKKADKGDAYLALQRENEALKVELNALREAMPAGAPALGRKMSVTVAPGVEVEATPTEVDMMRREFAAFSASGETVAARAIPELYEKFEITEKTWNLRLGASGPRCTRATRQSLLKH